MYIYLLLMIIVLYCLEQQISYYKNKFNDNIRLDMIIAIAEKLTFVTQIKKIQFLHYFFLQGSGHYVMYFVYISVFTTLFLVLWRYFVYFSNKQYPQFQHSAINKTLKSWRRHFKMIMLKHTIVNGTMKILVFTESRNSKGKSKLWQNKWNISFICSHRLLQIVCIIYYYYLYIWTVLK